MHKSITFFYPSKIIGGAEFLFIRLSRVLSEQYGIETFYIDYADGFARNKIEAAESKVKFINFYPHKLINLPVDTVVITPLSSIFNVLNCFNRNSNATLFFWSIYPYGLKEMLSHQFHFLKWKDEEAYYKFIGTSLSAMASQKAISFMDGPNLHIQERIFGFTPDSNYLPIPCEDSAHIRWEERKISNTKCIAWLGRLSKEKIYSLINILDHCNQYLLNNKDENLELHIIGDGDCANMLSERDFSPRLKIILLGSIQGDELKNYLVTHVDLLFAMGTSALEGASLQIPTILVDFSYTPIPLNNRFRWLYESEEYSLGDLFDAKIVYLHTFDDIVSAAFNEGKKHSDLCYRYFQAKHSLSTIAGMLVGKLGESSLTLKKLELTKFNSFQNFKSLRRMKNYIRYLCKKC